MSHAEDAKDLLGNHAFTAEDTVYLLASLDPDEVGYGQPFAFTEDTRRLISKCKAWVEDQEADEGDPDEPEPMDMSGSSTPKDAER